MRVLFFFVLVAVGATACAPPPLTQPAPAALIVTRRPGDVVLLATRQFAADGYDVTLSDAGAGTVVATKRNTPEHFGADLACRWPLGSMGSRLGQATLRVTVTARDQAGSSAVQIATHTTTTYEQLPFKSPASEDDCVSSGRIEKRLSDALNP